MKSVGGGNRRFIPAHAGNTVIFTDSVNFTAVYPRSRGEHTSKTSLTATEAGLSPLTRGTRRRFVSDRAGKRFIPAHAGNTRFCCISSRLKTVYPRSRGEHKTASTIFHVNAGLSPLTRGTRPSILPGIDQRRFIPAHAGNTRRVLFSGRLVSVYPRSRGEHFLLYSLSDEEAGLSPLTRGTPHSILFRASFQRFIPAHAGNTVKLIVTLNFVAVYPRSRGEHPAPGRVFRASVGLSPLTRGTQNIWGSNQRYGWFIPAHAGNTSLPMTGIGLEPVYPRSRGEHVITISSEPPTTGLSPLTRGTH
nr:hypothetical protein EAIL5_2894 [Erwinia amylovora ATCC BAA-2158]